MKVIYPGSFNPWTIGHQDIYNRALKLFGSIKIVIAKNPEKEFDYEFVKWTLEPLTSNLEIVSGLVAPDCDAIIRGVRSGDWEYEQGLSQWNKILGAETVFLSPDPALSHISSSAVRTLYNHGVSIDKYVGSSAVHKRWINYRQWQKGKDGTLGSI